MKYILQLLMASALLWAHAACSGRSEDSEGPNDRKLAVLKAELDTATTQLDMTQKSHAISQHLDQKLTKLEALVRKDLSDPDSRALFDKAAALWREYREAQAEFAYSVYRDGSMRGLVYNSAFAGRTEDRIKDLQNPCPDPKYTEDGQGGWTENIGQ
jgi:uncharacterized protein YecT (DUF1311 family)